MRLARLGLIGWGLLACLGLPRLRVLRLGAGLALRVIPVAGACRILPVPLGGVLTVAGDTVILAVVLRTILPLAG